jgi:hypothetical protein
MPDLSIEQQFLTTNPEYKGCVLSEFKRNMFTGGNQCVVYDVEGNRLAIVQQNGYCVFEVYPAAD